MKQLVASPDISRGSWEDLRGQWNMPLYEDQYSTLHSLNSFISELATASGFARALMSKIIKQSHFSLSVPVYA